MHWWPTGVQRSVMACGQPLKQGDEWTRVGSWATCPPCRREWTKIGIKKFLNDR
jgi:hypothetical protein